METNSTELSGQIQMLWTLMCAALVLLMQAGFCCVEAGTVRHKSSINVAIKNVVDLCVSFPAFYVVGFAIMFGADRHGLFGAPTLFLADQGPEGLTSFLYQAAFCSTAATIVSGGVAERCRFLPYLLVTVVVALLIYPVFGHAVWGGGLLAQHGYHDFAGSSVVHMVGAGVTIAGIQVLGPRQDRFAPDGSVRPIPASSMPMVALGVVILLFGWIGFNGGSAPLGTSTPQILANTLLAACFGGMGALLSTWAYRGMAAVDVILNGVLGGLVAITACADVVSLHAASLIGIVGGLSVVLGSALLERLRLDDAVGAVPVHGVAGVVGVLATAALGNAQFVQASGHSRGELLAVQAIGAGVCILWSYGIGYLTWTLVGRLVPLRVGPLEESVGLNYSEHQVTTPAQQLANSISHARSGEAEAGPDGQVADGDFAALGDAIRDLARDTQLLNRRMEGWSQDLDSISGTLDLHRRVGREALETYQQEMTSVDRSLYHIAKHLSDGRFDGATLAVAIDSVINLRRRLELVQHKLPSAMDGWEAVERMVQQIDRLAGTLRGDLREPH